MRGISLLLGAARKLKPRIERKDFRHGIYFKKWIELSVGNLRAKAELDNIAMVKGLHFGISATQYHRDIYLLVGTRNRALMLCLQQEKGGGCEEEHH